MRVTRAIAVALPHPAFCHRCYGYHIPGPCPTAGVAVDHFTITPFGTTQHVSLSRDDAERMLRSLAEALGYDLVRRAP